MLCFARLALLRQRSPEATHHIQLLWHTDTTEPHLPALTSICRRQEALAPCRSLSHLHTHTHTKDQRCGHRGTHTDISYQRSRGLPDLQTLTDLPSHTLARYKTSPHLKSQSCTLKMHVVTRRGVAILHTGRGKKPKNRQVVTPREQRGYSHFQHSTNFNKFNVITQNEWNVLAAERQ